MRSSIPISCSEPEMSILSSLLLNIRNQSKPITSARPFLVSDSNFILKTLPLLTAAPECAALCFNLSVQLVVGHKVDVLDPGEKLIEMEELKREVINLFSEVTGMESPSGLSNSILV